MPICMLRPSSLAGPENGPLIPRVISVAVTPGAVAVSAVLAGDFAALLLPPVASGCPALPPKIHHATKQQTARPSKIPVASNRPCRRGANGGMPWDVGG